MGDEKFSFTLPANWLQQLISILQLLLAFSNLFGRLNA